MWSFNKDYDTLTYSWSVFIKGHYSCTFDVFWFCAMRNCFRMIRMYSGFRSPLHQFYCSLILEISQHNSFCSELRCYRLVWRSLWWLIIRLAYFLCMEIDVRKWESFIVARNIMPIQIVKSTIEALYMAILFKFHLPWAKYLTPRYP